MTQQTLTTNTTTMNRMRDGFDRLFDSMLPAFARTLGVQSTNGGPAMNIVEDDVNIYVETELPGIELGDIELSVTNDVLTIAGSRVLSTEDETTVLRRERVDYDFERSISIPVSVELDRTAAEVRNGVLTVTLPKAETSRTRRIVVAQG